MCLYKKRRRRSKNVRFFLYHPVYLLGDFDWSFFSTTLQSLPAGLDTSAQVLVKDSSTLGLLASKTSETVLLAEELVDVLLDDLRSGGSNARTINLKKRLAGLSIERVEAVKRPVARLDCKLGVLDKVGTATLDTVLDARAVAENQSRARIVIGFIEGLHCLSRIGVKADRGNIDVAVSHGDGTKVLLCAVLTSSGELVDTTLRSSLRHLTTSVTVNLSIEDNDTGLRAHAKNVIKTSVVDIVGPTITTHGPVGDLDKGITEIVNLGEKSVGFHLLVESLNLRDDLLSIAEGELGISKLIEPLLKKGAELGTELLRELLVGKSLSHMTGKTLTESTLGTKHTESKLGVLLKQRHTKSRTPVVRSVSIWARAISHRDGG